MCSRNNREKAIREGNGGVKAIQMAKMRKTTRKEKRNVSERKSDKHCFGWEMGFAFLLFCLELLFEALYQGYYGHLI